MKSSDDERKTDTKAFLLIVNSSEDCDQTGPADFSFYRTHMPTIAQVSIEITIPCQNIIAFSNVDGRLNCSSGSIQINKICVTKHLMTY